MILISINVDLYSFNIYNNTFIGYKVTKYDTLQSINSQLSPRELYVPKPQAKINLFVGKPYEIFPNSNEFQLPPEIPGKCTF